MNQRDEVAIAVRATLVAMGRIARKTRTPVDDMMVSILQANERRLVDAVRKLTASPGDDPSDEEITEAFKSVGIQV
jgi:hypothetical protein